MSKIVASFLSLTWLAVLTKNASSSNLGTVLECLFISQSLIFLTDQGITPTLVLGRYSHSERVTSVAHIIDAVRIRVRRSIYLVPILVLLLSILTPASWATVFAIVLSHTATAVYSTINTGLSGSELRYVEAISESTSRLFAVLLGVAIILTHKGTISVQVIVSIYAAADLLMLIVVGVFFFKIRAKNEHNIKSKLVIDCSYRIQSTLSMGASSTIGVGESWALSVRSTSADYAFYSLIIRVIGVSGLIASYLGYSDRPELINLMFTKNWAALTWRCRKLIFFSILPTCALLLVVVAGRLELISLEGYNLVDNWIPIALFIASTPAVVMTNYLILTLQSVDPRNSTVVFLGTGIFNTVGVILFYGNLGIGGVFVFLSLANFLKAALIFFFTKRKMVAD